MITAAAFVATAFISPLTSAKPTAAQEALPVSFPPDTTFREALATLEQHHVGGRLGVAVLNTATDERLTYRADERFAMASTFKLLLVAAVLDRVDAGDESLTRPVAYGPSDLLSYAPVTRAHLKKKDDKLQEPTSLPVAALCAAAIKLSDNTAANLLLKTVGGPEGLTRYARSLGDSVTRLDRTEPALNENHPGDERDTTTPLAMARDLRKLLVSAALSPGSRARLRRWLIAGMTGDTKLRAGLGPTWTAGDKTGSGGHGASNDVAIAWPPGRAPVLITAYYTGAEGASREEQSAIIAEVGRLVKKTLED